MSNQPGTQKVGLEAVLLDKNFQSGLDVFLKGIDKAVKATESAQKATTQSSKESTAAIVDMGASMSALGTLAGGAVTVGLVAATGALVAVGGAAVVAVAGVAKLTSEFVSFTSQATLYTARTNEMALVTDLLGQRQGFSSATIRAQTQAIKDMGITTQSALGLQAKFAQFNLDMAQSTNLARIAQDSAVLTMQDSSEAMNDLMHAIVTGNKTLNAARVLGVDFVKSQDAMAESLGKTREGLTEQEKVQANLNAVFAAGINIAGAYEAAMEAPGKQLRSWQRDIANLKEAMGQPFQETFKTLVGLLRETTQWFTAAVSEGGFLFNTLINLGSISSLFADGLSEIVRIGQAVLEKLFIGMSANFGAMASNALQWGINIAVQFADGLIKGISGALVGAMNFINSLLTNWLAPGSPPKVAPDLIKWGMGAMKEWLYGFGQADFGVLKSIQAPLEKALGVLVDMGKMGQETASQQLMNVSQMLTKALATGKSPSESLFKRLAATSGEFGNEIAKLARLQFSLLDANKQLELSEIAVAKATEDTQRAEEALTRARERELKATQDVDAEVRKYNQLIREGADAVELQTQAQQIKNAEALADSYTNQRMAADDALEASKNLLDQRKADLATSEDVIDSTEEQIKNQGDLIDQLVKLSKTSILPAGEKKEGEPEIPAVGGVGGVGPPGEGEEDPSRSVTGAAVEAFPDIGQLIADKIADGKQAILDAFSEIFKSVREKVDAEWGPALENIGKAWEGMSQTVRDVYDRDVKPKFDDMNDYLTVTLPNAWEEFKTGTLQSFVDWLNSPGGLVEALNQISGEGGIMENMVRVIGTMVMAVWNDFASLLKMSVTGNLKALHTLWADVIQPFLEETFYPFFNDYIMPMLNDFADITLDAINDALRWINSKLGAFNQWLIKLEQALIDFEIPDWLEGHSPPPLANWLSNINQEMEGLAGMTLPKFNRQMGLMSDRQPAMAMAQMPIVNQGNTRQLSFTQNNNINDRMDAAAVVNSVERTVQRMFS